MPGAGADLGPPVEQFAQGGQRAARGFGARGERFVHAREIVPVDVVHLRFKQNVRMPGPGRLQRVPVRCPEDRDRIPSPRFPMRENLRRWNRTLTPSTQPPLILAAIAVGTGATMQPSASRRPSYSTGLTSPGKAQLARMATSSGPLVKYVRRAGVEIRGHDRGGNGQLFHGAGAKPFLYKLADAILSSRSPCSD